MKNLISVKSKVIGWGGLEAFSGSFWFYRIPKRKGNCSFQELFKMSSPCLLSICEHICALPVKIGSIFSSSNYRNHNEIYPAPFHVLLTALSRWNAQLPWVSLVACKFSLFVLPWGRVCIAPEQTFWPLSNLKTKLSPWTHMQSTPSTPKEQAPGAWSIFLLSVEGLKMHNWQIWS